MRLLMEFDAPAEQCSKALGREGAQLGASYEAIMKGVAPIIQYYALQKQRRPPLPLRASSGATGELAYGRTEVVVYMRAVAIELV